MQLRPEKTKVTGEAEHEYKSFREGPPIIIEPSRIESSQLGYQQGHSLVSTPTPLTSNHLSHAEPSNYHNVPDIESLGFGASMSPISPRTRCPSLTESVLSSTTCASSGSHSPVTPISERGSISSTYGDPRGNPISTGLSYRDVQRNHHRHQHSHHHQHRVSKSYQSSGRPYSSLSPPPLPMTRLAIPGGMEHTKEKMTKHEKRRINHLNSEKKRRENIKDGMDALLKLVPQCTDPQMSKANILKKTKEFIMELHEVNKNLQIELKRARQENDELRRYVGHQQDPYKFACRL